MMFGEVEQNMEVVVPGEHATRKTSRRQIMELRSISNNNNASSSTTCALMTQHNEELTVHHGTNGIFLNHTRIMAIGQYSAPQAGYLNVPQAPLSNLLYIGHTNPLITLSDQSHIINMNSEGAVANNINSKYLVCINNMDPNSSHGYPNTQTVILPQFNNNQISQPGFIPNIRNEIAVPMIQLSDAPEIVALSDDSNENGKSVALPSDGDGDNDTTQKQISLQNCVKDNDNVDKEIHCVSNSMIDSDDGSNDLSEFIIISKPNNNTISKDIRNDSDDVILSDTNENLNVPNSTDEISNLQTFSPLNQSSNLSSASKSTRCSSSLSTLSLNRNDSFLSKPSCSQECDKEFDKMLNSESDLNINKSKDKILVQKESFEDVQDVHYTSARHEECNDDKSCIDLESEISHTLDETVSTVLENEVADDLVEILTGLDSSPQKDCWSVHSERVIRAISELPDLSEYNFDSDNTSVCADNNEETERRNSEFQLMEKEILDLKALQVTMEPSEYKKDAYYFKEFLKLDYTSTDCHESEFSIQQEKSYRGVKHEDDNMSLDEGSVDLRLDSCYHGLFKRNVMRQSILNPLFSSRTLLEHDMRTMSISVRSKKNKKKEQRVNQTVNVTNKNRCYKISNKENSEHTTYVHSRESNYLVRPFTFPTINSSTVIADNSDIKKRTSQLHELKNQTAPYSHSRRPSRKKRPRKKNFVECQMENSLVNHPDDFLQYPSQDERPLGQENHSQLEIANGENLNQLKNDNLKNSSSAYKRLQNLISEADSWLQDTTIRGRTRSQSRNKQNEADQKKDSRINSRDKRSTKTVIEAPKNKRKKSQSETAKAKNSKKSISPMMDGCPPAAKKNKKVIKQTSVDDSEMVQDEEVENTLEEYSSLYPNNNTVSTTKEITVLIDNSSVKINPMPKIKALKRLNTSKKTKKKKLTKIQVIDIS